MKMGRAFWHALFLRQDLFQEFLVLWVNGCQGKPAFSAVEPLELQGCLHGYGIHFGKQRIEQVCHMRLLPCRHIVVSGKGGISHGSHSLGNDI